MKKRYLNLLIVLAIAAVLTAAFSGCEKKKEDTSLDDLHAAVSWYEEILESAESDKSEEERQKFVVVIPAGCGAELLYGADFLCAELSKYVGYDVYVVYDSEYEKSLNDVEILVGLTNRPQSKRYIKQLRTDDYGYEAIDGALQIGGHSDALCLKAINSFLEVLEEKRISLVDVDKTEPFSVLGDYDIDEIKLCGFNLYEYDIVYPESNAMSEKALANILRDRIAEYSGYSLRVISDRQCTDATRAICVGKSSLTSASGAENEALISVSASGNVELISDKNAGIYFAIEEFVNLIKQSEKNKICNLELVGAKKYSYNGQEISFCIVRDSFTDERVETVASVTVASKGCSLAVFDDLSKTVESRLGSNLETLCDVNGNSFYYADGINFRCIFAQSEILSGGGELLSLIMERADGKRFAFVGGFSHGAADGEELLLRLNGECEKYADLPLVVAHELGDDFDRRFDDTNRRLTALQGSRGIYFSSDSFALISTSVSRVGETLSVEILNLDFYYT